MNETYAQALLDALTRQRDAALNEAVRLSAQLAVVQAELAALKAPETPFPPIEGQ